MTGNQRNAAVPDVFEVLVMIKLLHEFYSLLTCPDI
jgi:hypothetical protein